MARHSKLGTGLKKEIKKMPSFADPKRVISYGGHHPLPLA
jgi:hypothetical protein